MSEITPLVTVITPTFNRPFSVLKRCISSVDGQTYKNWKHLVIIDDTDNNHESHIPSNNKNEIMNERRNFICLGKRSNNYGNTPRQLGIEIGTGDYFIFLDDDNVIFPNYIETMVNYLELNKDKDLAICKIIHMGPLPTRFGEPPKVLDGNPPILQNIDTLQVCVRREVVKKFGWLDKGYLADGHSIQNWCENCDYVFVDEILGVHL
jgi:glycosyltransferase involved in cell wall biosynthesis